MSATTQPAWVRPAVLVLLAGTALLYLWQRDRGVDVRGSQPVHSRRVRRTQPTA
ncbi:MAG TPA: hypothetical protein VGP31_16315 [Planosporangium sp.]|nr:hypothetical protein [Planosporangium sp.]